MAVTPIFPVLLLTVIARCRSEYHYGYNSHNGNKPSQFSVLLKPPPPPQLSSIVPVPFHRGERPQGHKSNIGYHYQTPPPHREFKLPAPFHKQYNFNFAATPKPFTTTPAPSMLQKVSGWLFPSQQKSYAEPTMYNNNVASIKKECNPCNLVPWLPIIRYNLGAKSFHPNPQSTYGPPNPTAYADALKNAQKYPQPFSEHNQNNNPSQLRPGIPYENYGPPVQRHNSGFSNSVGSTYGPPSPTHTLDTISPNTPTSTLTHFSQPLPNDAYNSQFLTTSSNNLYNAPSSSYRTLSTSYATPSPVYGPPHSLSSSYLPVTPQYDAWTLNKQLPQQSNVNLVENVSSRTELQVPDENPPTAFKNSYGEPITNTHLIDISYPVSATAAESTKVKTQVLPNEDIRATTNVSFALSNPSPFTLNRGRNIHTLQPVALPNLSVSPLPPIFNARPFRPTELSSVVKGINEMQLPVSNVHIQESIPLAEYTHSVEYPPTIIQSPIIEVDPPAISNQTKGYRNIPNSYVVDEIRDISSQASESVSATKSISDISFESTGTDFGNELYESGIPFHINRPSLIPSNHKPNFVDLRGLSDEDVDKYRTESNLQNIDSPLLYLKPSAPHKNHGNFVLAISSPTPGNDYEIYDEIPTTTTPFIPTLTSIWDDSKNYYPEEQSSNKEENKYKPKILQIIIPYTTGNVEQESTKDYVHMDKDWPSTPREEFQARKVPTKIDYGHINTVTEHYSTETTSVTEESPAIPTEALNPDPYEPADSLNDHYDVKEPPFDIIKLQHTIDDWTVQEYSKQYKAPQKSRNSENYAKKIPDNYFTTTIPANHATTNNDNDEIYDHEGSSSIQYSVTDDNKNKTFEINLNEYNIIETPTTRHVSGKNDRPDETVHKLHIYTAASSFRTTSTTTPAPWGRIQTSISPFTKEKVYVVTSKPWREIHNNTDESYEVEPFQSNKTSASVESFASVNLPFRSPRFMSRPSFGFTSGGKIENDQSYGFSKRWFQSINQLETSEENSSISTPEQTTQRSLDEDMAPTTANTHRR